MSKEYQVCLGSDCFYFKAYGAELYYSNDEVLTLEILLYGETLPCPRRTVGSRANGIPMTCS